jgi:hypothetical protein
LADYSNLFGFGKGPFTRYLIVRVQATVMNPTSERSKPIWVWAGGSKGHRDPADVMVRNKAGVPRKASFGLFYPQLTAHGGRVGAGETKRISYLMFFKANKPVKYDTAVGFGETTLKEKKGLSPVAGGYCR